MKFKDKRIIGVTGGIGAGKSYILGIISEQYHKTVIEADLIGHMIQETGTCVYDKIVDVFGTSILAKPNIPGVSPIDRKALGAVVFSDKAKLEQLNNITHPAIHQKIIEMINNSSDNLIFIEAAILTETSLVELVDQIWLITAPTDVRIDRLCKYRGITAEKASQVIKNQPDDNTLKKHADVIINNCGSDENIRQQIEQIMTNI